MRLVWVFFFVSLCFFVSFLIFWICSAFVQDFYSHAKHSGGMKARPPSPVTAPGLASKQWRLRFVSQSAALHPCGVLQSEISSHSPRCQDTLTCLFISSSQCLSAFHILIIYMPVINGNDSPVHHTNISYFIGYQNSKWRQEWSVTVYWMFILSIRQAGGMCFLNSFSDLYAVWWLFYL